MHPSHLHARVANDQGKQSGTRSALLSGFTWFAVWSRIRWIMGETTSVAGCQPEGEP